MKFESFPDENYPTIVSTALAGGKGGDVIHTHAYGWLEQFVKAGYFEPQDLTTVPSLANQPADALVAGTYRADKKVYSLPFASQTLGLFINKDVFAKAGLTPPTTWDEFITVSKALKEKGIYPLANGMGTSWFNEMFVAIFTNPFLGQDFRQRPDIGQDHLQGPALCRGARQAARTARLHAPRLRRHRLRHRRPAVHQRQGGDAGRRQLRYRQLPGPEPGHQHGFRRPANGQGRRSCRRSPSSSTAVMPSTPSRPTRRPRSSWSTGWAPRNSATSSRHLLGNISPIKGVVIKDELLAHVAKLNETAMPHINVVYFRFEKPTGSELLQGDITKMMSGSITPDQLAADLTDGLAKWYKPFQGK